MHSNLSMLTISELALLVKPSYLDRKSSIAALGSYLRSKGIQIDTDAMIISAVKTLISKFEAIGCSDDRLRSGRPSANAYTPRTVREEMEIVFDLSPRNKVSAGEFARFTFIPCSIVWVAL